MVNGNNEEFNLATRLDFFNPFAYLRNVHPYFTEIDNSETLSTAEKIARKDHLLVLQDRYIQKNNQACLIIRPNNEHFTLPDPSTLLKVVAEIEIEIPKAYENHDQKVIKLFFQLLAWLHNQNLNELSNILAANHAIITDNEQLVQTVFRLTYFCTHIKNILQQLESCKNNPAQEHEAKRLEEILTQFMKAAKNSEFIEQANFCARAVAELLTQLEYLLNISFHQIALSQAEHLVLLGFCQQYNIDEILETHVEKMQLYANSGISASSTYLVDPYRLNLSSSYIAALSKKMLHHYHQALRYRFATIYDALQSLPNQITYEQQTLKLITILIGELNAIQLNLQPYEIVALLTGFSQAKQWWEAGAVIEDELPENEIEAILKSLKDLSSADVAKYINSLDQSKISAKQWYNILKAAPDNALYLKSIPPEKRLKMVKPSVNENLRQFFLENIIAEKFGELVYPTIAEIHEQSPYHHQLYNFLTTYHDLTENELALLDRLLNTPDGLYIIREILSTLDVSDINPQRLLLRNTSGESIYSAFAQDPILSEEFWGIKTSRDEKSFILAEFELSDLQELKVFISSGDNNILSVETMEKIIAIEETDSKWRYEACFNFDETKRIATLLRNSHKTLLANKLKWPRENNDNFHLSKNAGLSVCIKALNQSSNNNEIIKEWRSQTEKLLATGSVSFWLGFLAADNLHTHLLIELLCYFNENEVELYSYDNFSSLLREILQKNYNPPLYTLIETFLKQRLKIQLEDFSQDDVYSAESPTYLATISLLRSCKEVTYSISQHLTDDPYLGSRNAKFYARIGLAIENEKQIITNHEIISNTILKRENPTGLLHVCAKKISNFFNIISDDRTPPLNLSDYALMLLKSFRYQSLDNLFKTIDDLKSDKSFSDNLQEFYEICVKHYYSASSPSRTRDVLGNICLAYFKDKTLSNLINWQVREVEEDDGIAIFGIIKELLNFYFEEGVKINCITIILKSANLSINSIKNLINQINDEVEFISLKNKVLDFLLTQKIFNYQYKTIAEISSANSIILQNRPELQAGFINNVAINCLKDCSGSKYHELFQPFYWFFHRDSVAENATKLQATAILNLEYVKSMIENEYPMNALRKTLSSFSSFAESNENNPAIHNYFKAMIRELLEPVYLTSLIRSFADFKGVLGYLHGWSDHVENHKMKFQELYSRGFEKLKIQSISNLKSAVFIIQSYETNKEIGLKHIHALLEPTALMFLIRAQHNTAANQAITPIATSTSNFFTHEQHAIDLNQLRSLMRFLLTSSLSNQLIKNTILSLANFLNYAEAAKYELFSWVDFEEFESFSVSENQCNRLIEFYQKITPQLLIFCMDLYCQTYRVNPYKVLNSQCNAFKKYSPAQLGNFLYQYFTDPVHRMRTKAIVDHIHSYGNHFILRLLREMEDHYRNAVIKTLFEIPEFRNIFRLRYYKHCKGVYGNAFFADKGKQLFIKR
ncbi:MAG: hypothetical protein KIT27_04470 [Legionellales bacterium]|nr:hypothetical protein [Legionellales bacterium]